MNYCDLNNNLRYQNLRKKAGISDFKLNTFVQLYYNRYLDFPYLDEIPGVNSENYIKLAMDVKSDLGNDYLYANNDKILEFTNTSNINDAMAYLNKESDLEIGLLDLGTTSIVKIDHRPSEYDINTKVDPDYDPDQSISVTKTKSILANRLDRLRTKFGINLNLISDDDIDKFPPDAKTAAAFVYNGEIYINIDKAKSDAPIHEMMHIFLGAVRYTNSDLYISLINSVLQIPNIKDRLNLYNSRTMNDALEEVFVEEFSKYITGLYSIFNNLPDNIMHKLMYLVVRNIDSFILGRFSVKSLPLLEVFNSNIQSLAEAVLSDIINNKYKTSLLLAEIHRMLANSKERLLSTGELIQNCK